MRNILFLSLSYYIYMYILMLNIFYKIYILLFYKIYIYIVAKLWSESFSAIYVNWAFFEILLSKNLLVALIIKEYL